MAWQTAGMGWQPAGMGWQPAGTGWRPAGTGWQTAGTGWQTVVPLIGMAGSFLGGLSEQKKAGALQDRQLRQAEQQYYEREPLRRLGMTALGQVEAPMNLGNLGFNPANPFAAARGPAPSTASYGDWGRMTYTPETANNAVTQAPNRVLGQDLQRILDTTQNIPGRANREMREKLQAEMARRGIQPLGGASGGGYGWER